MTKNYPTSLIQLPQIIGISPTTVCLDNAYMCLGSTLFYPASSLLLLQLRILLFLHTKLHQVIEIYEVDESGDEETVQTNNVPKCHILQMGRFLVPLAL